MGKGKFLGEFEQVVLLAVACLDGEGYGMTIRREIEQRTGRRVSIGPVYSTLRRLEAKGHLTSRVGEATPIRGGRATRYFQIEPEGIQALQASRTMLDQMWEGVWFEAHGEGT
jgi:DNA-binding PadR family transcriptional regulator